MAEETQTLTGKQDFGTTSSAFGGDDQSTTTPMPEETPVMPDEAPFDALQAQIARLSAELQDENQNDSDTEPHNGDLFTENEHGEANSVHTEAPLFPEAEEAERVDGVAPTPMPETLEDDPVIDSGAGDTTASEASAETPAAETTVTQQKDDWTEASGVTISDAPMEPVIPVPDFVPMTESANVTLQVSEMPVEKSEPAPVEALNSEEKPAEVSFDQASVSTEVHSAGTTDFYQVENQRKAPFWTPDLGTVEALQTESSTEAAAVTPEVSPAPESTEAPIYTPFEPSPVTTTTDQADAVTLAEASEMTPTEETPFGQTDFDQVSQQAEMEPVDTWESQSSDFYQAETPVTTTVGEAETPFVTSVQSQEFEAHVSDQVETHDQVEASTVPVEMPTAGVAEEHQAEEFTGTPVAAPSETVLDRILSQNQAENVETAPVIAAQEDEEIIEVKPKKKARHGLMYNAAMILVTTAALGGLVFVAALVWFGNFEADEAAAELAEVEPESPVPAMVEPQPLNDKLAEVGYTINYTWRGGENGKIVRTAEMQYLDGTIRIQDPVYGRIYLLRGGETYEVDAVSNQVTRLNNAKDLEKEYLIVTSDLLGELKGRDKETLHGGLYKVEIYDNYKVYSSNEELGFIVRLDDGKEFTVRSLGMGVSENFDKLPGEAPVEKPQASSSGNVVEALDAILQDDSVLGNVSAGEYLVFE